MAIRGLQLINRYIAYAKSNVALIVAVFGLFMLTMSAVGFTNHQNAQASNPDNDIVRGGIYARDLAAKCHGDVKTIMDHYWIDCNLTGAVDGRVCRDGNVYVGDRVVARDANSIGRLPKQGSHPVSIGGHTYHETATRDAFLQECLNAFVKLDQHGSFQYAILKDCGNPIYSPSPVVVTPPPPEPKVIEVCRVADKKVISIKENEYDANIHSKNLADCDEVLIQVCNLITDTIRTIEEDDFDADYHTKDLDRCVEVPIKVCDLVTKTVKTIDDDKFRPRYHTKDLSRCDEKMVQACDIETGQIVTVTEDRTKLTRFSTNFADCESKDVTVCNLSTKQIITIDEDDFDASIHSYDQDDCTETEQPVSQPQPIGCVENPKAGVTCELPKTGPADFLTGGIGMASLAFAGSYYSGSRRDLLNALLGR